MIVKLVLVTYGKLSPGDCHWTWLMISEIVSRKNLVPIGY